MLTLFLLFGAIPLLALLIGSAYLLLRMVETLRRDAGTVRKILAVLTILLTIMVNGFVALIAWVFLAGAAG